MNERDRLTQLRALRARIERLPESAERDRMLAEIGRRTVDVECNTPATPVRPPAVLQTEVAPLRAPAAPTRPAVVKAELAPRRATATPTRPAVVAPRRAPATTHQRRTLAESPPVAAPAPVRSTPSLPDGLRLSLGDDDATAPDATGRHRPTPPWA